MLRITLIIAIIAGLGAAALNVVVVKDNIEKAMTERDGEKTAKEQAMSERDATKKTLKKTSDELESTKKTLANTEADLKKETALYAEADKSNKDLTKKLKLSEGDRTKAEQELAQWKQIPLKPDQIKALIAQSKKDKMQLEVTEEENQILHKNLTKVKEELARLIGTDEKPPEMPGLKGSIVAVDPKYDFVVLDVGGNQGARERGELLVNRKGKLVAKVKIFSVEANRCIANIMANWKQGEVMEGDQVLY